VPLNTIGKGELDCLILRIGEGDLASFEKLYLELKNAVYLFALTICKDDKLAEDILQETFLGVWSSAKHYQGKGYGRTWVLSITRHIALNYRNRSNHEMPYERATGNIVLEDCRNEEKIISHIYVNNVLDEMCESDRNLIIMHLIVGLKLSEIAKLTSKPLGTICWQYSKAMKKAKSVLSEGT
jgi:RNA polymerase sigma factor (sigma-70 family)